MELAVEVQIRGEFTRIGTLSSLPGLGPTFTYDEEWLCRPAAQPLSLSIPLTRDPVPDRRIRPYFEGLLPEEDARRALSRELGVSPTSYLKMLAVVGEECIGAVSLEAADDDAPPALDRYRPLTQERLESMAASGHGLMSEISAESRLSLAGAQAKAGLYLDPADGKWYQPLGRAPSSHIVKPGTSSFPSLTENEMYCMGLARACGLPVPAVSPMGTKAPMMALRRYDRVPSGDTRPDGHASLLRLHQEDACQALGILPSRKYEEGADRRLRDVGELLRRHSSSPEDDALALFDAVVFNFLIGNCDAHLKNFSLVRCEDWSELRLAPLYDLVCTTVYPGLTRTLAMRIGGRRKIDAVGRDDLLDAARDLGIGRRPAAARMGAIADSVAANAGGMADGEMASEIARQARERAERIVPSVHPGLGPRREPSGECSRPGGGGQAPGGARIRFG